MERLDKDSAERTDTSVSKTFLSSISLPTAHFTFNLETPSKPL
jgi:hypothetical protein